MIREATTHLHFDHMGLEEIPEEVFQLSALESLNLSFNRIKTLPKEIAQLRNLKALYVNGNQLTVLPDEIRYPEKLEEIIPFIHKIWYICL